MIADWIGAGNWKDFSGLSCLAWGKRFSLKTPNWMNSQKSLECCCLSFRRKPEFSIYELLKIILDSGFRRSDGLLPTLRT